MVEQDLRQHIQHLAEDHVYAHLARAGYHLTRNGYHSPADILVNDTIRIEVKGSLWVKALSRKGRYQFNTRNNCDFYILYCIGTRSRCFVIPHDAIGERKNVAIWSEDPRRYKGQWSRYLNAWHLIAERANQ